MRHHELVARGLFAATLGFACIVEFSHFRRFHRKNNLFRMAMTMTAAISAGYIASEALDGEWPSWYGYKYHD